MAYGGKFPFPIQAGGTNNTVLDPGILLSDGNTVSGNPVDEFSVLIGGSSNTVDSLGPSVEVGYALVSQGAGMPPTFAPVPGASMVWLGTQDASNSTSVQFTSLISSPYTIYKVFFYAVYPVNDTDDLWVQISNDNGATWQTTGYLSGTDRFPTNSSTLTNANTTSAFLACALLTNDTSLCGACGSLDLYNFLGVNLPCYYSNAFNQITGVTTSGRISSGGGVYATTFNANAIQFVCSTGNISSGVFSLYGIKEES